jgi:ubiquinone/menaquinone biosynthesis C-methylase UbiE
VAREEGDVTDTDNRRDDDQKAVFLNGEGDAWFDRNCGDACFRQQEREAADSVLAAFETVETGDYRRVLEVGCANGWRLSALRRRYRCDCFGIDPSKAGIAQGKERFGDIDLAVGTADDLPFEDGFFDVVILGFCLYLCDRKDLFKIAWQVDRVLAETGRLYIRDFDPPFAYKNRYAHFPGLYSYKMPYADMFLWNPAYSRIYHRSHSHHGTTFHEDPDERIGVSVLGKNTKDAYPENPFG